jgi:hypothetical protein
MEAAAAILIDVKCVVNNGDESCSKTIPSSRIWGLVNGAESLQEVPTVEISVVANNTRELARPFSSGGRSITVGDAGELDGLVSDALLVREVPCGRADFDPRIHGDRSQGFIAGHTLHHGHEAKTPAIERDHGNSQYC